MITLYHCPDARSFRALWALHEIGLDYDLVLLPFPPRVHDRTYLDINPLGTIPFLIDGETVMSESAAIRCSDTGLVRAWCAWGNWSNWARRLRGRFCLRWAHGTWPP